MSTIVTVIPPWLVAILLFALLWAASRLGTRLRIQQRSIGETPFATSAAVSLLVLLIGFTFSMALNRYDSRRDLVVEEAAAITSLWQRALLVAEPQRSEISALARAYADQRLAYFSFGVTADKALRADQAADDITQRLWKIVGTMMAKNDQPLLARMLTENLTRIDDAAWRREAMSREHIPPVVLELLAIFAACTAVSMGFAAPVNGRVHPTHLLFFGLTAAALMLMLDIDQPQAGLVQEPQRPIMEIIAIMAAHAGDPERALPVP
jgi:hypothetical protein